MNTASACTICSEYTHKTSKCPELRSDTKEGFYSGGGSNRDYGGEDDRIQIIITDGYELTQFQGILTHTIVTISTDQERDTGTRVQ